MIEAESVSIARNLRDREPMKYRGFCEVAACEVTVATANGRLVICIDLSLYGRRQGLLNDKIASGKASIEAVECCCRVAVLCVGGESEGELTFKLRATG